MSLRSLHQRRLVRARSSCHRGRMSDGDRNRMWEGRILLLLVALIVGATVFGLLFLDPHTAVR